MKETIEQLNEQMDYISKIFEDGKIGSVIYNSYALVHQIAIDALQVLTEKDATIDEQQTEMDRINNHLYKACMDVEALRKALEEIARIESHINITTIRMQEIAKSALGEGDKE